MSAMTARQLISVLETLDPNTRIYGDGTPRDEVFQVTKVNPIRFTRYDPQLDEDVEHEGACLS